MANSVFKYSGAPAVATFKPKDLSYFLALPKLKADVKAAAIKKADALSVDATGLVDKDRQKVEAVTNDIEAQGDRVTDRLLDGKDVNNLDVTNLIDLSRKADHMREVTAQGKLNAQMIYRDKQAWKQMRLQNPAMAPYLDQMEAQSMKQYQGVIGSDGSINTYQTIEAPAYQNVVEYATDVYTKAARNFDKDQIAAYNPRIENYELEDPETGEIRNIKKFVVDNLDQRTSNERALGVAVEEINRYLNSDPVKNFFSFTDNEGYEDMITNKLNALPAILAQTNYIDGGKSFSNLPSENKTKAPTLQELPWGLGESRTDITEHNRGTAITPKKVTEYKDDVTVIEESPVSVGDYLYTGDTKPGKKDLRYMPEDLYLDYVENYSDTNTTMFGKADITLDDLANLTRGETIQDIDGNDIPNPLVGTELYNAVSKSVPAQKKIDSMLHEAEKTLSSGDSLLNTNEEANILMNENRGMFGSAKDVKGDVLEGISKIYNNQVINKNFSQPTFQPITFNTTAKEDKFYRDMSSDAYSSGVMVTATDDENRTEVIATSSLKNDSESEIAKELSSLLGKGGNLATNIATMLNTNKPVKGVVMSNVRKMNYGFDMQNYMPAGRYSRDARKDASNNNVNAQAFDLTLPSGDNVTVYIPNNNPYLQSSGTRMPLRVSQGNSADEYKTAYEVFKDLSSAEYTDIKIPSLDQPGYFFSVMKLKKANDNQIKYKVKDIEQVPTYKREGLKRGSDGFFTVLLPSQSVMNHLEHSMPETIDYELDKEETRTGLEYPNRQ